jgi:ankyrin repeat protein
MCAHGDARSRQTGRHLLMIAALARHADVTGAWLAGGAAVGATDANGWTPLMYASQRGHTDVVAA